MKKKRFLAFLLLSLCLLTGCRKTPAAQQKPQTRTVARVQVQYTSGRTVLQRTYTKEETIRPVLMYLRLLEEKGRAAIDPERLDGSSSTITVEYTDGRKNVYYQRCEQYLSRNGQPWQKIDLRQGKWLLPLLKEMPSDEK